MKPEGVAPRLAFLGLGWIGRLRLEALVESGCAEVVGLADPSADALAKAAALAKGAQLARDLDELLALQPDGLVIATPSAAHAAQAVAALERGIAVFCQKPLALNAAETARVLAAAERADRLLGVDLSYRHTRAIRTLKSLLAGGELGDIYAARFVFHNAYGPDKSWYYDRGASGGGCVVDLGTHLVDLALWLLPGAVREVTSRLYARGRRLALPTHEVEDFASAILELEGGASVELTCSWNLPAGRDAVIEAHLYGRDQAVCFHNVDGSFYDFALDRMRGTRSERIVEPPDAWGGRALLDWVGRLRRSRRFDPSANELLSLASVLDRIAGVA